MDLLINPAAGRGRAASAALDALVARGVPFRPRTVEPERLEREVARRVAAGDPVVGVAGGDGSIVTGAQAVAGTESALAVVPLGTLNHFARRLGIPDPDAAARALAAGRVERLPVGVLDDRLFLNTLTFGLYADVVRRRDRLGRGRFTRWPAAALALGATIARHRVLEVGIETEEHRLQRRTPLVWVGVGRGSFEREEGAPPWDAAAELEIVLAEADSRSGTIGLMARSLVATLGGRSPLEVGGFRVLHSERLVLWSRHRVGITRDGETSRDAGPLFVAVLAGALRVVVPPDGLSPPAA